MSESLEQFFVRYAPDEDRLALYLSSVSGPRCQLWITRRLAGSLLDLLDTVVRQDSQVVRQASDSARDAVLEFRRQQALEQANFSRQLPEASHSAPALFATGVSMQTGEGEAGGRPRLVFDVRQGGQVTLGLNPDLAHAVAKVVADAVRAAQWNLERPAGVEGAPPSSVVN
ncbi:MAG: hypothetical protein LJE84_08475 [Gammaproteobacteria bacterium]|jgi:hypothetical protein|nr:hypothetical protein [Gammaproteobacteria bacterium]